MAKINVLDRHTAELIAAGEVVERPASVIKELVENSIDAGASNITVELQNGGITFMRVTDNGCGIEKDDVKNAFLRHATSKVADENDLDKIGTLGFRGEALASIAAVAKVELLTKSDTDEFGTRYVIHGSDEISFEEAGCPRGTTIIVRDIFYNVPARMKFLKRNVSEANAVASVLDRLALSHTDVAFTFIRDGRKILATNGDSSLKNAIYSVFGADFSKGLVPVNYQLDSITVTGFVTKPQYSRATRSMQVFFINGRFVKSRTVSAAVEEASKGTVMVGKFPGCVLHIDMPLHVVDVNVHPAKTEIRFINERPVFETVYYAVKSAVTEGDTVKEFGLKQNDITQNLVDKSVVQKPFTMSQYRVEQIKNTPDVLPTKGKDTSTAAYLAGKKLKLSDSAPNPEDMLTYSSRQSDKFFPTILDGDGVNGGFGSYLPLDVPTARIAADEDDSAQSKRGGRPIGLLDADGDADFSIYMRYKNNISGKAQDSSSQRNNAPDGILDTDDGEGDLPAHMPSKNDNTSEKEASASARQESGFASEVSVGSDNVPTVVGADGVSIRYVGEAFKTYIIAERGDDIVLIDKHAAHERIIYERLKRDEGRHYAQYLIEPAAVTLSKQQYDAVLQGADKLEQSGFEVEDFGQGTVLVRSAPSFLDASEIPATIEEMAEHIIENKMDISTEYMDWLYHTIACRSAIKGGDLSSPEELMRIAAMLTEDTSYRYCPHGRPTSMVITRRELEKQFGRTM